MCATSTPTEDAPANSPLWRRIHPIEWAAAAIGATAMAVAVALEPDIVEAPFASGRSIAFTVGGTIAAAAAFALMLRGNTRPAVRVLVLGVPFVAVNWWLLSPYFSDEVVDDRFETSIEAQRDLDPPATTSAPTDPAAPTTAAAPVGPVLLGAGSFVGLAGHEGTGEAGVFRLDDESQVLRFENFDIENGPDLEVYLVPGADRTSLDDGSIHLGPLQGNIGDQTYEIPGGGVDPGPWTAFVWCEAFSVEFVGATISVAG
jgi:hypothetical protein